MILNHTEKEFISAITTYACMAKSLEEELNKSKQLERKGIGLVNIRKKNFQ